MQSIVDRVDEVAAKCVDALSGDPAASIAQIRARLSEPLRLAVIGARDAGKSTLVNALLHSRVAPTDSLECTKLVAWYRFDEDERVEVVRGGNPMVTMPLDRHGMIPAELGEEAIHADHLRVWLNSPVLSSMTLIDTPGFDSSDELTSARSRELFERHPVDAMVFVLNRHLGSDERDAIDEFSSLTRRLQGSAVNAIGVLTKIDYLDDDSPWEVGDRLASELARELALAASTVEPVMGLLAETAAAHAITGTHFWHLQTLAELPEECVESVQDLADAETSVSSKDRVELTNLIGMHGIRYSIELIKNGLDSVDDLQVELLKTSGLADLKLSLANLADHRSAALKARSALADIQDVLRDAEEEQPSEAIRKLQSLVGELKGHPDLHVLNEIEALEQCLSGEVVLPEKLVEDLRALATGNGLRERLGLPESASPRELAETLSERQENLMEYMNFGARQAAKNVAFTIMRSYILAAGELDAIETTGTPG